MKRARVILVVVALAGVAGGFLAYVMPTVYYKPAYVGGECTVAFTPYYSVVTDRKMPGREVLLAKEPGRCEVYVVVGE
jgi:hypothetical protein